MKLKQKQKVRTPFNFKEILTAFFNNEQAVNDEEIEKEVQRIISSQNSKLIENLEIKTNPMYEEKKKSKQGKEISPKFHVGVEEYEDHDSFSKKQEIEYEK